MGGGYGRFGVRVGLVSINLGVAVAEADSVFTTPTCRQNGCMLSTSSGKPLTIHWSQYHMYTSNNNNSIRLVWGISPSLVLRPNMVLDPWMNQVINKHHRIALLDYSNPISG